jgi:uncharacterized membrane protein
MVSKFGKWFLHQLRGHFFTGILFTVPIGITVLILIWLFDSIDNILQPVIIFFFDHPIRGVGFGVLLLLIYIIGLIASNFIGKRLYSWTEAYFFNKIPVVKQLYQGIKQIMEAFSKPDQREFLRVVMVEFPRKGSWMVGFITNQVNDEAGNKILHIFVPHSPNPLTGFVLLLKESEVIYTKMTVEEASRLIVSAGRYVTDETMIATEIYNRDLNKEK